MANRLNEISYALIAIILASGGLRAAILLLQMIAAPPEEKAELKKKLKGVIKFVIIAAGLSSTAYLFKDLIYGYLN